MKNYLFLFIIMIFMANGCDSSHSCADTVTDIDGNIYKVTEINSRCWLANNLKTSRYSNGDVIPNVTDDDEWITLESGAWAYYDNDSSFEIPYGKLYNWYAVVDDRGLCPEGWRVPTDEEWTNLKLYLGDQAGGKLKITGTDYWNYPNQGASNETGFSALPTGYRTRLGPSMLNGAYGYIWSSSEDEAHPDRAWRRGMMFSSDEIVRFTSLKILGFSVRCIED